MKKFIILFSIILLTINNLFADPGKTRFHVIIDTDCAPDDLRAIVKDLLIKEVEREQVIAARAKIITTAIELDSKGKISLKGHAA